MRATPFVLALGAVASLAFAPARVAAVSCPTRVPAAITPPSSDAGKDCQTALAKAAVSFVKTQLKTDAKCLSNQIPGTCPGVKDTEKIQKAAIKAQDSVVKACSAAGALTGLTSSYSTFANAADVASCTLSQNNAEGKLLAYTVNGTPGVVKNNKDRDACVKALNSSGVKYALGVLQTINKCVAGQIKAGTAGDLAAVCVGQYTGLGFTVPSDTKTADKLAGLLTKMDASITKSCGSVSSNLLESIYACGGASTAAGFTTCLACESWDSTLDILAAQYSETGTLVAPGAGAIQAAVDASAVGAKLLLKSGLYQEDEVLITNNGLHEGLQLVGCGGATDDRPRIDPPTMGGPFTNGIRASSVDHILFQSLDVGPWPENGIKVEIADGVSFRDVISDAAGVSLYAVFPVQSNDVLVEGCTVSHVSDAGIYVGQSTDITVRYNTVLENVAGIEIENSSDASVHNNYANGNTGGLLVFKLPGPPVQISNNHEIFFNVSTNNNRVNVGGGTVGAIPDGTGMLVLSNDDGDFHHNLIQGNDSFGLVLLDQLTLNVLSGTNFFNPPSPDQKSTGNRVRNNNIDNTNGTNPDTTGGNSTQGVAGEIIYEVIEQDAAPNYNFNCFEGNGSAVTPSLLGAVYLTVCP